MSELEKEHWMRVPVEAFASDADGGGDAWTFTLDFMSQGVWQGRQAKIRRRPTPRQKRLCERFGHPKQHRHGHSWPAPAYDICGRCNTRLEAA